jgi:hypothetical protein
MPGKEDIGGRHGVPSECTADASAQYAATERIRIVVESKRLRPDLAQLFEPFDRGALGAHFTLENLGFSGKVGEIRGKSLALTSHGYLLSVAADKRGRIYNLGCRGDNTVVY